MLNFSKNPKPEKLIDPYGVQPPDRVSDTPIPQLMDNPTYSRLVGQRDALIRGLEERQQTLTRYSIRAELAANSTLATGPRKQLLQERLNRLDSQIPRSIPEPDVDADGLDPLVAQALKLAAGEEIAAPPDRDAHIQRLRAESRVLEDAIRLVRGQMEEVREAASIAVNEALLPQHWAIQREKLRIAIALSEIVKRERALNAEILLSGHSHMPGILLSPPLDPAVRLGVLDEWDSPISQHKRTLASLGITP